MGEREEGKKAWGRKVTEEGEVVHLWTKEEPKAVKRKEKKMGRRKRGRRDLGGGVGGVSGTIVTVEDWEMGGEER